MALRTIFYDSPIHLSSAITLCAPFQPDQVSGNPISKCRQFWSSVLAASDDLEVGKQNTDLAEYDIKKKHIPGISINAYVYIIYV